MNNLPNEILLQIFNCNDIKDIVKWSRVSSKMYQIYTLNKSYIYKIYLNKKMLKCDLNWSIKTMDSLIRDAKYFKLLEGCIDYNITLNDLTYNILVYASENNHLEIVKLLLQNGFSNCSDIDQSLKWASIEGNIEVIKMLLEYGANPCVDNNSSLILACIDGRLEIVKLLLENGANPSVYDNQSLRFSAQGGHLEVVRVLLEYGVDPSIQDNYALRNALENGYYEIVKLLKTHLSII
jgi:ankyrin repeat protein